MLRPNLPIPASSFVGREEELARLQHLLIDEPNCRLLTLVGLGGIGKTRLSLQAAQNVQNAFPDGAVFVPLSPVDDPTLLPNATAQALALPLQESDSTSQLLAYLSRKQLLLIFDNFEHLLSAGNLLSEIILAAPMVKILVTSRERLNLQEEWILEVGGMAVPQDCLDPNECAVEHYGATQLFLDRLEQLQSGFVLTSEERLIVMRICRRVGGMPLALELAASWGGLLSCAEIEEEIIRSLDFLTSTMKNLPERHRSLRAIFNYTWMELSKTEQDVLQSLTIFRGGFERRAAEQVAETEISVLAGLAGKALVRRTPSGRYQIHEVIRQFATEHLALQPTLAQQVEQRHAEYYLNFLIQREKNIKGPEEKEVVTEIAAEFDNIRTGWNWAVGCGHWLLISQAIVCLGLYGEARGLFQEIEHLFRYTVESYQKDLEKVQKCNIYSAPEQTVVYACLLAAHGWFQGRCGDVNAAYHRVRDALILLQPLQDQALDVWTLICYLAGTLGTFLEQFGEMQILLEQSLTGFAKLDDQWGMACTYLELGGLASMQADYDAAGIHLEKGYDLASRLGNQSILAQLNTGLGQLARMQGHHIEAQKRFELAVDISTKIDHVRPQISAWRELGHVAQEQHDLASAQQLFARSLRLSDEIGWVTENRITLVAYAGLYARQGDTERALELLGLIQREGIPYNEYTPDKFEMYVAEYSHTIGATEAEAALRRGSKLDLSATVIRILESSMSAPAISHLPGIPLEHKEIRLLKMAFSDHTQVHIVQEFTTGRSGARVLLASLNEAKALVVAKLGKGQQIMNEFSAYQTHVYQSAPLNGARIEGTPVFDGQWLTNDDALGLLTYTYMGTNAQKPAVSLLQYYQRHRGLATSKALTRFFEHGQQWWSMRRSEEHTIGELYDQFLPEHLQLRTVPVGYNGSNQLVAGKVSLAYLQELAQGSYVRLINFKIMKTNKINNALILQGATLNHERSIPLRLRLYVADATRYTVGNIINSIDAAIITTRMSVLQEAITKIYPDYETASALFVPHKFSSLQPPYVNLPRNPLLQMDKLTDTPSLFSMSIIHGDLNFENLLIDEPTGFAWMIDFEETRDGPTLFDCQRLEVQIITKLFPVAFSEASLSNTSLVHILNTLHLNPIADTSPVHQLQEPYLLLHCVRRIAGHFLVNAGEWDEYYGGLLIMLLGTAKYPELSSREREFAYLAAAVAKSLFRPDNVVQIQ